MFYRKKGLNLMPEKCEYPISDQIWDEIAGAVTYSVYCTECGDTPIY